MAQDKLESRLQSLRLERQVTCPKPLREEVDTEKRLKNPGDTDPFVSHFVSSTGFSTKDQEKCLGPQRPKPTPGANLRLGTEISPVFHVSSLRSKGASC